jgi:dipeptidyl aminopeptidase/acylaminoacyl peptidase
MQRVRKGAGAWEPVDVAGDTLLVRRYRSELASELWRFDAQIGEGGALTHGAAVTARLGPAGEIYAITDGGGDRMQLVELAATSGALEPAGEVGQPVFRPHEPEVVRVVSAGLVDEVDGVAIAAGGTVAFTTNHDGTSRLYFDARGSRREAKLPATGVIADLAFARAADVLAYTYADATHPREVYLYDLRTDTATRVTDGGAIPAAVVPRHERAVAADGTGIAMLVYQPAHAHAPPVVVELHGGPEDQWRPRYQAFEQFLVARGYALVQPNVRGSLGYGRAFASLDDGPLRANVIGDVRAVLDWIATRPELDATRVVVMGQSYGGFLALASLQAMPDRLRGAIDMAGIADLASFLATTSAYRRDQRRAEYGDERDPAVRARLDALSPLHHAIARPILVAAGAKDPRVPPADAARLVAEVRRAGVEVWSIVADDEGHGFAKPANRGVFEVLAVQFLDRVCR